MLPFYYNSLSTRELFFLKKNKKGKRAKRSFSFFSFNYLTVFNTFLFFLFMYEVYLPTLGGKAGGLSILGVECDNGTDDFEPPIICSNARGVLFIL